jgi:hypothetical protein
LLSDYQMLDARGKVPRSRSEEERYSYKGCFLYTIMQ